MISFCVNEFDASHLDDPLRVSEQLWAEFDAAIDPESSGSFAGTVADVLAAADSHTRADQEPPSVCRWCQEGGCDCPDAPVAGTVPAWLADLAARPVDSGTRLAVAVIDPSELSGQAVRDLLTVTEKVLAADTAASHDAVLAVADTAHAEITAGLDGEPVAQVRWGRVDTDRAVREDVERTLHISGGDAAARIEVATDLRDRLPVTRALLGAGMLSARKATQLSHLLGATSDPVAAQVDAELAPRAQTSRPASLRRRVARRIAKLDPNHASAQEAAVVRDRRVRRWSDPDGSATLALTGPPEQVQRAWIAITGTALAQLRDCPDGCRPGCPHALTATVIREENLLHDQRLGAAAVGPVRPEADSTSGTDRPGSGTAATTAPAGVLPEADSVNPARPAPPSAGVRSAADTTGSSDSVNPPDPAHSHGWLDRARFDAAVELVCSVFDAPWYSGGPGRRRTLVQLVTTAHTLTGTDDDLSVLVGHGPVTAATARRIAADADLFQEVLVHPRMGFLLDAGAIRHDPPERLREFLLARRPHCSLPGCDQPAATADLDHSIEHRPDGSGGPTAAWSMGPLCRFHHRARTLHLWRPSQQRCDGSISWTDHTGRTWHQPAHDLRPDPPQPELRLT